MDEASDDVAVGSADLHLSARFQYQKAFAIGVGFHLADLIQIDDR
jgi:hypothetical protein